MSGIDAAGLLLGIFPLLLTAAEKYERGYEILTDWIQFRREFANFYSQLQCQRILLRQLTETTLSSVTELGVDVQTMLDNPDCEQWKDVVITEKLKQKLSREGEYEVFCSGLWAVHEQLNELAKQLKVDNLQVSSFRSRPCLVAYARSSQGFGRTRCRERETPKGVQETPVLLSQGATE